MQIILLEDTRNLGERGQQVKVKPGYARNFLIPQGIALEATTGNLAYFSHQKRKIDVRHTKILAEAQTLSAEMATLDIRIVKRVGDKETLYGSLTVAEVAERLAKKGFKVDKRRIDLGVETTGIKTLGEYRVRIDLHQEVTAEVVVNVVSEEA
jgi:large subunit ribosomal protein L9